MKKINSIWYGGKVILAGIIFALLIPIGITISPLKSNIFHVILKISVAIGGFILIGFSIWLIIEFHQDKKINRYYYDHRNTKLKVGEDRYECQLCGNREVKETDKSCSVCGAHFEK